MSAMSVVSIAPWADGQIELTRAQATGLAVDIAIAPSWERCSSHGRPRISWSGVRPALQEAGTHGLAGIPNA